MKTKKMFISFIALAVFFAFAQMAMAYSIMVDETAGYYSGNGGEFTVHTGTGPGTLDFVLSAYDSRNRDVGAPDPSFQTFCLETNEFFNPGWTYEATLSNAAVLGGVGGGSPDPISMGTAYLYSQFATGTLLPYDYTVANRTTAGLLQTAIWWLEGEVNLANPMGNTFINYVNTKLGLDLDQMRAAAGGAYGVMALNLWVPGHIGEEAYRVQDQLVLVPIPAAVWLLGSGLIGLVGIRRRFKD